MYIWLAIDVNEQLNNLRKNVSQLSRQLDSVNTALTLPLHISLRISFRVDDTVFDNVINRITEIYSTLSSFEIETDKIEKCGNVVWIKVKKSLELEYIHKKLVDILLQEYNVQSHEYDMDFLYHISLFIDGNMSKVDAAYKILHDEDLPSSLMAERLIIGCSETGHSGEYKVVKMFELGRQEKLSTGL